MLLIKSQLKHLDHMPHVDDILDVIGNARIFSKIDLKSGYQ